jgi:hypothetical protein
MIEKYHNSWLLLVVLFYVPTFGKPDIQSIISCSFHHRENVRENLKVDLRKIAKSSLKPIISKLNIWSAFS